MTSLVLRPTIPVRPLLVAAGLAALIVAALLLLRPFGPSEDAATTVKGPSEAPFTMTLADGWKTLPAESLDQLPGAPLAVVRRSDGSGTVVVSRNASSTLSFTELAAGLRRRLRRQFPDLREVSAKVLTLPAGRALVYSFARTKTGVAQTLAIVPAGTSTYTVNAVVRPGTPATAQAVGAMLGTFDVR